jgi:hypothetical protein
MTQSGEQSPRRAREEEAVLALGSTVHPDSGEAEWRRLPDPVRHGYRRVAGQAPGFDPRGFDAHGTPPYSHA